MHFGIKNRVYKLMNTSEYIQYNCIASVLLKNQDYPEYPYFRLSGTGFFVKFPPFETIFFVTGKHCVIDNDGKFQGDLEIALDQIPPNYNKKVIFLST
jgi:hypothetical protein